MRATLYTDGGARGNPGPAGIGYVLEGEGSISVEHGEYIGYATNNQAEYRALLAGLGRARQAGVTHLSCFLDSELVVEQLNGNYRVKNADLKPLFGQVQELAREFSLVVFDHVPRSKNKRADALVNKAIDAQEK